MKINKKTLESIYTLIVSLPPLDKAGLPPAKEVVFDLLPNGSDCMATYVPDPDTISVCAARHQHFTTLLKSMLHEVIHMTNHLYGKSYLKHTQAFKDLRRLIAKEYGFDENEI